MKSDRTKQSHKLLITIVSGLLGFAFSPFGIVIFWDKITIDLPWSILFPLLVSMGYGWRYGLIAGLSGGALYSFLLWPVDGWVNLTTTFLYLSLFIILGLTQESTIIKRIKRKDIRILFALIICISLYAVYFRFVFNPVLSLNPPFWTDDTVQILSYDILFGFFFKDSINLIAFVIITQTLLRLPFICNLMGLSFFPSMKTNNRIFVLTILISVCVWLIYVGLGQSLLQGQNILRREHITLALLVIITSGVFVANLLMYYTEKQFDTTNKLYESEQHFRTSIDFNPLPISVANTNSEILFCNKQYTDTFGYTIKDTPTMENWFILAYPDESYRNSVLKEWNELTQYAIKNNVPTPAKEFFVTCKNGEVKTVEISCYFEKDLAICTFQDITLRKKTELELVNAKERAEESDRLKTAFLHNMSHEIRTPMNAIYGFSGMLNKPDLSEEKRNSFISIIQNSSSQLLSIVSDILTISSIDTKQEKLNIQPVCINAVLSDLLIIFKQQAINQNISMNVSQQLNTKHSEIFTDKTKVSQILTNLLTNALKFTQEGGIEFGYNLKGADLEFYVKDTGLGIKKEFHDKIFERFRQADTSINKNYGGTGLGLSISKGFVEILGGRIWLESEPGAGSTFYFTVPYNPVNENVSETSTSKQTKKIKTILVAEDEEYNYLLIQELLSEINIKLIHSKNGKETVDVCIINPNIDLILMDIKMPVMDGHTAAKQIKESRPDLPIIAQSAYALEHEIERYSGIFDDYLTKPINEKILVEKINKFIG